MVTRADWQRTTHLKERVLALTFGVSLTQPQNDYWSRVVAWSLILANARLKSIYLVLNGEDSNSTVILTRSLFELVVTLWYIFQDVPKRLRSYLEHGQIPLTPEQIEQRERQKEAGAGPSGMDIVPKRAWKNLRQMCEELDRVQSSARWVDEYNTFYRYASVPTHAGAFTIGRDYLRFLAAQPLTDNEKAVDLATAVALHLRVAEIAAKTFPDHIDIDKVQRLDKECGGMLQSLIQAMVHDSNC